MVQARRKNHSKQPPKIWSRLSALLTAFKYVVEASAVVALSVMVVWGGYRIIDQPIKNVSVEAPWQRVTRMQVDERLNDPIVKGFLSTDMRALQNEIASVPWVDHVRIERYWPAQLNIVLTEQVAMASWQQTGLLNTRGELFLTEARHIPEELPRLSGPDGSEWQVAQRYRTLNAMLQNVGWSLRSLELDERGAWLAGINNGVKVYVGVDEVDRRLDRFGKIVIPALRQEGAMIESIDLRYSNGFAVAYKERVAADQKDGDSDKHA